MTGGGGGETFRQPRAARLFLEGLGREEKERNQGHAEKEGQSKTKRYGREAKKNKKQPRAISHARLSRSMMPLEPPPNNERPKKNEATPAPGHTRRPDDSRGDPP